MKFEAVRIHFLSDVFGLLSSKNFATMTTWRNDFSLYSVHIQILHLSSYISSKNHLNEVLINNVINKCILLLVVILFVLMAFWVFC